MNQLKAGVILNFAIIGLNTLTGLLYTPYMMRCLGQNEYGLYSLVASIIAYLAIFNTGFNNTVVRFTARFRANDDSSLRARLFGTTLIINSLLSVVVIAAGVILCANVGSLFDHTLSPDDIRQARIMLVILTANLALTFPLSVFSSINKAYERFIFQKTLNLLRIILVTLTIVLLLANGYKAIAMVAVQASFNILLLLANLIYARRRLGARISFRRLNKTLFREVTAYSFWLFLNEIVNRTYWSTGQFILGAVSGTIAVAIFSAAIVIQQMYQTLSGAITDVLLPRVSHLTASTPSDHAQVSDLFLRTGRMQAALLMLLTSGFIVFGRGFFAIWAGEGYESSFYVALILLLAMFPSSVQNIGIVILQARNRVRFSTLVELIVSALSVVAQYFLARTYGPIGCAAAIGLALIIGPGLIFNLYYRRTQHINTTLFWRNILKMAILPATLTLAGLASTHWLNYSHPATLLAGITIYLAIYLPLFYRLSLTAAERTLLHSIITRKPE